mmetsp:Transcript_18059/g.37495  ORF Transcript_18059/g.37495 Transcript_18059/m.37495 type:complete len:127 (-) Transcript_18059:205-585(-)
MSPEGRLLNMTRSTKIFSSAKHDCPSNLNDEARHRIEMILLACVLCRIERERTTLDVLVSDNDQGGGSICHDRYNSQGLNDNRTDSRRGLESTESSGPHRMNLCPPLIPHFLTPDAAPRIGDIAIT